MLAHPTHGGTQLLIPTHITGAHLQAEGVDPALGAGFACALHEEVGTVEAHFQLQSQRGSCRSQHGGRTSYHIRVRCPRTRCDTRQSCSQPTSYHLARVWSPNPKLSQGDCRTAAPVGTQALATSTHAPGSAPASVFRQTHSFPCSCSCSGSKGVIIGIHFGKVVCPYSQSRNDGTLHTLRPPYMYVMCKACMYGCLVPAPFSMHASMHA